MQLSPRLPQLTICGESGPASGCEDFIYYDETASKGGRESQGRAFSEGGYG